MTDHPGFYNVSVHVLDLSGNKQIIDVSVSFESHNMRGGTVGAHVYPTPAMPPEPLATFEVAAMRLVTLVTKWAVIWRRQYLEANEATG